MLSHSFASSPVSLSVFPFASHPLPTPSPPALRFASSISRGECEECSGRVGLGTLGAGTLLVRGQGTSKRGDRNGFDGDAGPAPEGANEDHRTYPSSAVSPAYILNSPAQRHSQTRLTSFKETGPRLRAVQICQSPPHPYLYFTDKLFALPRHPSYRLFPFLQRVFLSVMKLLSFLFPPFFRLVSRCVVGVRNCGRGGGRGGGERG